MTTPPASPPPPHPAVASESPSTLKRTRKATRLRSLATRPPGAERPVVHVDLVTDKADGPHKKKLRKYLGIVARDKVDVTYEIWKEAEFEIPEASDGRTKKKVLQTVGEWWWQFKSDLTRKWTLAANKDGVEDTVSEKYDICKEKWAQFCQTCSDPSWEDVRKKAQAIQKQNTAPHMLSHGGYDYLEQKLMSRSTEGATDPPSPIRRHMKWKMARTKKTGQIMFEAAKEIVDKIVSHFQLRIVIIFVYSMNALDKYMCYVQNSLEEQASQGSFVPHGRQDLLTTTIGAGVTIKQNFGLAPRSSPDSTNQGSAGGSIIEKVTQQLMLSFNQMQSQLQSQIQSQGLALPPEPEVGPSATRVSTKGSCVDPSPTDLETGDLDKCGLYIKDNPSHLVALGRVYEGSIVVHNIPLLHGQVKAAVSPAKSHDRPDHEVNDPLYLMTGHWQMVIILLKENLVVWFSSLNNRPNNYFKGIINSALKGLDDTPQPKSKAGARRIVVKCNRQKGSTECGYYVMHWMSMIILGTFRNNWETIIFYFKQS
ncbi:hypothetical protein HKD37_05G012685 [Glycine soja]